MNCRRCDRPLRNDWCLTHGEQYQPTEDALAVYAASLGKRDARTPERPPYAPVRSMQLQMKLDLIEDGLRRGVRKILSKEETDEVS